MADQQQDNEELKTEIEKVSHKYSEAAEAINALTAFTFLNPAPLIPGRNDISEIEWLRQRALLFAQFVQEVAEKTGADTLQLWDREKRTEEQTAQLKDAAAQFFFKHTRALYDSAFMSAVETLRPIKGSYNDPGDYDMFSDGAPSPDKIDYKYVPVKQQAITYYFATHDTIKPGDQTPLKKDQAFDLEIIYRRLDALYYQTANDPDEPDPVKALTEFIAIDCGRKRQEQSARQLNETQDVIKEPPLLLQALKPQSYKMVNSMAMNYLQFNNIIEQETTAKGFILPVIKGANTYIKAYRPEEDAEIAKNITPMGWIVTNAVSTLLDEAIQKGAQFPITLTASQIYSCMPGAGSRPGARQLEEINDILQRGFDLVLELDATDELVKRGILPRGEAYRRKGHYFNFYIDEHEYIAPNGKVIDQGFVFLSFPLVYDYSAEINGILSMPIKYLTIKESIVVDGKRCLMNGQKARMSPQRQAIAGYIYKNVEWIRHEYEKARKRKKRHDIKVKQGKEPEEKPLEYFMDRKPVMLFDSIFNDTGLSSQSRQQAAENREFIYTVLENLKQGQTKRLINYREYKKGKRTVGVKILC